MSILFAGGEDIDFPIAPGGASTLAVVTAAGNFRAGYTRSALQIASAASIANISQTKPFPGGAVTSAWFAFRWNVASPSASRIIAGVTLSGSTKGLFIGTDGSTAAKVALVTLNGSTRNQLAAESGTSVAGTTVHKVDVQIANYGASATVNVYFDSILVITFTGDVTVSGMSNFDTCAVGATTGGTNLSQVSEFVVADEDTRPMLGVLTMAPNGVSGTTDAWSGTGAGGAPVNPTSITDANAVWTNSGSAVDEQFNLIDLPSGSFVVKAVRIAARAWITAGATATKLKLGFGTTSAAADTAQTVTTGATTYERMYATNPETGAAWGDATEINALNVDMRASS